MIMAQGDGAASHELPCVSNMIHSGQGRGNAFLKLPPNGRPAQQSPYLLLANISYKLPVFYSRGPREDRAQVAIGQAERADQGWTAPESADTLCREKQR